MTIIIIYCINTLFESRRTKIMGVNIKDTFNYILVLSCRRFWW